MSYSSHSSAVHLQPAYILQSRKFRETSLIFDVFTKEYGKVSILAKGVRKAKSKYLGLLQAFIPLHISYMGHADLKILTHVEIAGEVIQYKGITMYSGFYINELVQHLLTYYDPHPGVFDDYCECLKELFVNQRSEEILRFFELNFLEKIGYGLHLSHDIEYNEPVEAHKKYQFFPDQGPKESVQGSISGSTLIAMQQRSFPNQQALTEAKLLMRNVIDFHLQHKELKTRTLIAKVIKQINS